MASEDFFTAMLLAGLITTSVGAYEAIALFYPMHRSLIGIPQQYTLISAIALLTIGAALMMWSLSQE